MSEVGHPICCDAQRSSPTNVVTFVRRRRGQRLRRRDFILLVSSTAVPWSFAASAQQREGTLRHVGILSGVSGPVFAGNYAEFVHGMRELGYEEHKDFVTELRTADSHYERFPNLAGELVEQKVDILLTGVSAAIRYLQQATTTIPIVMVYSTDPVKNGFVASLAHPGGNITGLAGSSDDTAPKQLELLAIFVVYSAIQPARTMPEFLKVRRPAPRKQDFLCCQRKYAALRKSPMRLQHSIKRAREVLSWPEMRYSSITGTKSQTSHFVTACHQYSHSASL